MSFSVRNGGLAFPLLAESMDTAFVSGFALLQHQLVHPFVLWFSNSLKPSQQLERLPYAGEACSRSPRPNDSLEGVAANVPE